MILLGKGHCIGVYTDDSHVCCAPPDLGHLGASLADDAADELVRDGHLVALLPARAPGLACTSQQRQGCNIA